MQLSKESLNDLRKTLIKNYGQELSDKLNNEELNEIGNSLLVVVSENLKIKMREDNKTTQQSV
jgi:hypothetical protein